LLLARRLEVLLHQVTGVRWGLRGSSEALRLQVGSPLLWYGTSQSSLGALSLIGTVRRFPAVGVAPRLGTGPDVDVHLVLVHFLVQVKGQLLLVSLTLLREHPARLPCGFPALSNLGGLLRLSCMVSEWRPTVLLEMINEVDPLLVSIGLLLARGVECCQERALLAIVLLGDCQVVVAQVVPLHLRITDQLAHVSPHLLAELVIFVRARGRL